MDNDLNQSALHSPNHYRVQYDAFTSTAILASDYTLFHAFRSGSSCLRFAFRRKGRFGCLVRRHGGDVPDAGEHVDPERASHFSVAQVAAASCPRMPKIRKYSYTFKNKFRY